MSTSQIEFNQSLVFKIPEDPQQWRLLVSEMLSHVVCEIIIDVSEKLYASILRVEVLPALMMKAASFF
jgi:hypothetical protein